MDRGRAAKEAAKAAFRHINISPEVEQITLLQHHFENFARRQACGEWTVGGDSTLDEALRTSANERGTIEP